MHVDQLARATQEALAVVKKVATFIEGELGKVSVAQIETKSLNSLVSYVDITAEEMLVEGLAPILPDPTFLTEEATVITQKSEFQWIIDPLDGTTNFLHQIPVFAISVGLLAGEDLAIGIVYEVNRHEAFYAWKGGGAFLNGKPIRVRPSLTLQDALMATGFPYYDYESIEPYFEVLGHFMREARGIRRLGAAAVDLAYVACGRFDAFFEYSLNPWDVAGGAVIVREAGGEVYDFSGGTDFLHGKQIIATNPAIRKEMLEIVGNAFGKLK